MNLALFYDIIYIRLLSKNAFIYNVKISLFKMRGIITNIINIYFKIT